ncbi:hypothetical protein GCM10007298_05780 [Williamsia phyllosphaerae]|uniref:Uncharacterized protein n=1 Tax=Williamsia phyllosphaerae TaxID=885042 RepID=A0ABQ1U7Q8_9NOCA|nr:hypothetical protein GCM10007298_05780 [Williamsia phyllosphaerae]
MTDVGVDVAFAPSPGWVTCRTPTATPAATMSTSTAVTSAIVRRDSLRVIAADYIRAGRGVPGRKSAAEREQIGGVAS